MRHSMLVHYFNFFLGFGVFEAPKRTHLLCIWGRGGGSKRAKKHPLFVGSKIAHLLVFFFNCEPKKHF